jgi:hypothetical protein
MGVDWIDQFDWNSACQKVRQKNRTWMTPAATTAIIATAATDRA